MKQKNSLNLFFILLLFTCTVLGQKNNANSHTITINTPEVALISIHNSNSSINLEGNKITEAGKKVEFNSFDNNTWINYSSIIGSNTEPNRHVTIEVSEGNIPDGLNLIVKANNDVGKGDGKVGKAIESNQVLDNSPLKLIEGIGSCYTGVGINKGHNVSYSLKLSDDKNAYGKLDFDQSQTIALTYTLSDN